jgi:hypothetical protein
MRHTILFLSMLLAYGLLQAHGQSRFVSLHHRGRLFIYIATTLFELLLLGYVWGLGLRPAGKHLCDVIGGRWSSVTEFLQDVGVAFVFWMVVVFFLTTMRLLLGGGRGSIELLKPLLPQGYLEMAAWVVLSVTAGFCEEVIFRGYLQQQLSAITGNLTLSVVLQAAVFGTAHLYQGARSAVTIGVYGALFGILAVVRRSLRPGMIQHASQDAIAGIAGSILAKYKYF